MVVVMKEILVVHGMQLVDKFLRNVFTQFLINVACVFYF